MGTDPIVPRRSSREVLRYLRRADAVVGFALHLVFVVVGVIVGNGGVLDLD